MNVPDEHKFTVPDSALQRNAECVVECSYTHACQASALASALPRWPQVLRDVTNLLAVVAPIAVAVITSVYK
ncbi:hypothetical protein ACFW91_04440 [Streptomyces asoensis]|uniref:hypothetical protein n=1 Tax=Streptomyces asoensis TaxID=249586 RepID=UPI00369E7FF2